MKPQFFGLKYEIFFLLQQKFQNINPRMIILEKVQQAIKSTDMFYSKQFLRYKTNNQYKTITGGVVTIIVFITISISFASMILDTLARVNITYDTMTVKTTDPPLTTVKMGPGNKFMFGIRMMAQNQGPGNNNVPFNLSDSKRYFNINFVSTVLQSGSFVSYKPIPLQTCTKAHWNDFPNILSQYEKMQMGSWLCPPLNASFDLMGQYSSDLSKMSTITVTACNNYSNMNSVHSVCATPGQIAAYFAKNINFLFGYLFTNPVINPGQTSYIDYYLQSLSQAIFSENLGSENLINYADYQIDSDDSIWPFPSNKKDMGIILDGSMGSRPLTKTADSYTYLRMMLFKSCSSLRISRTVQKISSTFSYIGGFFGALATALFLLKIYTDQAFEISLVKTVFSLKKSVQENNILKNFNILKFLVVKLYSLVKMVNIPWKWEKGEYVDTFQEQIKKQLDVSFILHRLINLEKMMTYMLNEEQIKELKLCKRLTLQKIKMIQERLGYTDDFLQQNQPQKTEEGTTHNLNARQKQYLQIQRQTSVGFSDDCFFSRGGIPKTFKESIFVENINKQENQLTDIPVVFDKQYQKKQVVTKMEKGKAQKQLHVKESRKKDPSSVNEKEKIVRSVKLQIINNNVDTNETFY